MAGLFDIFTVAKRGLNVQQGAINTTSHNIANANTTGYSRQRAVAETTRPFGGMSRFDTCTVGQVGTGAEITSISRIRDSFIDYQIRNETGKLGNYEVSSKFLSQVEDVFGEPSDKGIQKLFGEFYASFQELAKTPEKSSARTVALQKSSAIADALNHTYIQLEKKVTDCQELLQNNVNDINSSLDQINELNQQIAGVCAVGQTPNDLMDKRDNLLDEVSKKFGITIDKQPREAINLKVDGFPANGASINNLVNAKPNQEYTRFSYVKGAELETTGTPPTATGKLKIQYYPLGDSKKTPETIIIDAGSEAEAIKIKGSLEQNRMLVADKDGIVKATSADELKKATFKIYEYDKDINNVDNKNIKGEVAGNQSAQDMIKGYMNDLDRIAASLAYSVNAIQTGTTTTGGVALDGQTYELLFINSNDATTDKGISARTITVNKKILDDVSKLNCSSKNTDGERNGDRAQAIAELLTTKVNMSNLPDNIKGLDRTQFFTNAGITLNVATGVKIDGSKDGKTMDSYYKDIISELGTKTQEANRRAETQSESMLKNLEMQKLSVSGVSLDEEMANLVQFQHAYSANAKIISTVDELLDVVINGLKR